MNYYLVKLDTEYYESGEQLLYIKLIKATHSDKAIEIAQRDIEALVGVQCCVKSCTKVNNVDVSILKDYLGE